MAQTQLVTSPNSVLFGETLVPVPEGTPYVVIHNNMNDIIFMSCAMLLARRPHTFSRVPHKQHSHYGCFPAHMTDAEVAAEFHPRYLTIQASTLLAGRPSQHVHHQPPAPDAIIAVRTAAAPSTVQTGSLATIASSESAGSTAATLVDDADQQGKMIPAEPTNDQEEGEEEEAPREDTVPKVEEDVQLHEPQPEIEQVHYGPLDTDQKRQQLQHQLPRSKRRGILGKMQRFFARLRAARV